MRTLCAGLMVLSLLVTPALAVDRAATEVTCAGAVTTGIGGQQQLRDLEPSVLPVLSYAAEPTDRQFKQLARFGDVPIRLYVYRVNEAVMHIQIYEHGAGGKAVLADTPLSGDMTELTYRPLGGHEMVTVYCY